MLCLCLNLYLRFSLCLYLCLSLNLYLRLSLCLYLCLSWCRPDVHDKVEDTEEEKRGEPRGGEGVDRLVDDQEPDYQGDEDDEDGGGSGDDGDYEDDGNGPGEIL